MQIFLSYNEMQISAIYIFPRIVLLVLKFIFIAACRS